MKEPIPTSRPKLISQSKKECVFEAADGRHFTVSPEDRDFVANDLWYINDDGYVIQTLTGLRLDSLIMQRMKLAKARYN